MIVAYEMSPHDGDAFFFEDRRSSIFCPVCGTLLDRTFLPTGVRPRKKWDICSTYENRTIVTAVFKDWCQAQGFEGLVFRQVNEQPPYYSFEPSIVLRVDPKCARFLNKCDACGNYESVLSAGPMVLLDIYSPIENGFFRSDIEFAGRWEKSPSIIVGVHTRDLIKQQRFRLVEFPPIEGASKS